MSRPMLERISVEILDLPPSGGFRLDSSPLNTGPPLTSISSEWTSITAEVRNIDIKRGSSREGLSVSSSVGTASIVLVEPPPRPLRPSTPIRITADGQRIFTGNVLDVIDTIDRSSLETPVTFTTVTAVDLVHTAANIDRFGAYQTPADETPWKGFETARERYERLLAPTGLEYRLGGEERFLGDWFTPAGLNYGIAVGSTERLAALPPTVGSITEPGTFGGTFNPNVFYRGEGLPAGSIFVRTQLDAPGWVTLDFWIEPFSGSHPDPVPPSESYPPETWRIVVLKQNTMIAESERFHLPRDTWTRVTKSLYVNTTGVIEVHIANGEHPYRLLASPITPSGYRLTGVSVTNDEYGSGLEIQNVVYESTLANHLDLVAATTHGAWWIDSYNVLQARTASPPPTAGTPISLTDGSKPGSLSYVDISLSSDTAGTVNTVRFSNHGRIRDSETNRWVAHDITIPGGSNPTAIATFGPRSSEIDTALPITPPILPMFSPAPRLLAERYLEHSANPRRSPRTVTIWHGPIETPFPSMDLRDPLDITHAGITYKTTITMLTHTITRHSWHTTADLIERDPTNGTV